MADDQQTKKRKRSASQPGTPKKKTITAQKELKKRFMALPNDEFAGAVVSFIVEHPDQEDILLSYLPTPSSGQYEAKLITAARAIRRALPHSRYGSCSDQYGFKRCSSAVTGFKKLWNEQMALLSGGQRSVFLEYASIAVDILAGECVRFDRREDNKYKEMCIKKVETLVKKVTEGRNVPPLSEAEKTLLQKYRNSLQSSFREYLPAPPPPQQQDPPPESSPEAPPQQQAPPPEAPPQAAELPPPTLVSESTVG